jgi:uncharacterized protein YgbK (DUF1537 family)
MIAVIADDLSGACEIASAAAARGVRAEVHTVFDPDSRADVVVVDTDSRSESPAEAARMIAETTRAILSAHPAWIYKKTDSVLRGNARTEIEAILALTAQTRSILIPANPAKGRTIRDGHYFIDGIPLQQTGFALDPEYPRHTSDLRELLGDSRAIETPDACDAKALEHHAHSITDAILPAGGVEFFDSILSHRGISGLSEREIQISSGPSLFVCGSAAAWRLGRERDFRRRSIPVSIMPDAILQSPGDPIQITRWVDRIDSEFKDSPSLMLAIGRGEILPPPAAKGLTFALIQSTLALTSRREFSCILLEGGATAAAFLQQVKWTKLLALPSKATGVAILSPIHCEATLRPVLMIKPGSYPWPDTVFPRPGGSPA